MRCSVTGTCSAIGRIWRFDFKKSDSRRPSRGCWKPYKKFYGNLNLLVWRNRQESLKSIKHKYEQKHAGQFVLYIWRSRSFISKVTSFSRGIRQKFWREVKLSLLNWYPKVGHFSHIAKYRLELNEHLVTILKRFRILKRMNPFKEKKTTFNISFFDRFCFWWI